ncbi:MAG: hypothetical protein AB2598_11175 [Candidatus Thiodiazotropha sp.]
MIKQQKKQGPIGPRTWRISFVFPEPGGTCINWACPEKEERLRFKYES